MGGWNVHQRAAWNLPTRVARDIDQGLRYIHDTPVPFHRQPGGTFPAVPKIHRKISGTFRSNEVPDPFAAVCSYIQTAAGQHGQNRLEVLHQLFTAAGGT